MTTSLCFGFAIPLPASGAGSLALPAVVLPAVLSLVHVMSSWLALGDERVRQHVRKLDLRQRSSGCLWSLKWGQLPCASVVW